VWASRARVRKNVRVSAVWQRWYAGAMDLGNLARQWLPFIGRTIAYGTMSLALGPLTPDRRASLWAMRRWCQSSVRGLDMEIVIEGVEHVPQGAFVYCSNHQSLLDVLVLGAALPGDFKWAAKRELLRIPFLGWHLQLAGHVPVERGRGPAVAAQVIARFEEVLRRGKPLLVFPEGTRSEDGVLKPFKNGGFLAAVRAGAPVVPVALEGTGALMEKGAQSPKNGVRRVRVRIGKPIQAASHGSEIARVEDLRDRTREAILGLGAFAGGRALAHGGARSVMAQSASQARAS
jgi:1-acyl-sn-glycerol-3-phosphate acyltransferase